MINYTELKSAVHSCASNGLVHFPVDSLAAQIARATECAALRQQARSVVGACAKSGLVHFHEAKQSAEEAYREHRRETIRLSMARLRARKSAANTG